MLEGHNAGPLLYGEGGSLCLALADLEDETLVVIPVDVFLDCWGLLSSLFWAFLMADSRAGCPECATEICIHSPLHVQTNWVDGASCPV